MFVVLEFNGRSKQFEAVKVVGQLLFKPWRMLSFRDFQDILQNEVRGENTEYVMRDEGEFMVGSIGLCETFWEQEILKHHHPDNELLISWVKSGQN